MEEKSRTASATADELYRQAQDHMIKARDLVRAARLSGLRAESESERSDLIDFDALPGRSPRSRAQALYMGRRIRDDMFTSSLFGEFAWDILLELYLARGSSQELPLDEVCKFAHTNRGTIFRYASWMTELGLTEIRSDPAAPHHEHVRLSAAGRELLTKFFEVTDGQMPDLGSKGEHWISSRKRH